MNLSSFSVSYYYSIQNLSPLSIFCKKSTVVAVVVLVLASEIFERNSECVNYFTSDKFRTIKIFEHSFTEYYPGISPSCSGYLVR